MMRRWAIQFWQGSSRAVLEVSAVSQEAAIHQARLDAKALALRLHDWVGRLEEENATIFETAMGAAIYNEWGPEGYKGQPFGADLEEAA